MEQQGAGEVLGAGGEPTIDEQQGGELGLDGGRIVEEAVGVGDPVVLHEVAAAMEKGRLVGAGDEDVTHETVEAGENLESVLGERKGAKLGVSRR